MDKAELTRRIEAGTFAVDNGRVLRTINILQGHDIKLHSLQYALPDIPSGTLSESLFYLQDAGYIRARDTVNHTHADVTGMKETTAVRLTAKGIQLLKGYVSDPAVKV
ncbi:hypothetical protein [Ethanoligenens sp.]|uniref:hypothetical protein n=1 Tax=Ethanoligenens sp. TaxID=2099655 RepID=UPI0039E924B6